MLGFFIFIFIINSITCEDVIVSTNVGPIKGQEATDGSYSTFFGIPYALVDEENPFGQSIVHPEFKTPFNASDPTIKCPQTYPTESGILQCLRLNIYVPKGASPNATVPVFVWFHGGGFAFGSAGEYDGKYLVQEDIIVVTVNYRLGPYGFLCLKESTVPGNQGMKDQITALRWIKDNIGCFGGNNQEVTIAGESFGGGSVDLHLFTEYETLFKRAIIQSGSIEEPNQVVEADHDAAIKLAQQMGYSKCKKNKDALAYLTDADPIEVMKAYSNSSLFLSVCKEKSYKRVESFMTVDPFHLSNPTKIKKTSILIGYNSKEDFASFVDVSDKFYEDKRKRFYDWLREHFIFDEEEVNDLANIIQTFYLGNKTWSKDSMLELVDMSSDMILNHGAESSVNRYINQGAKKVYKYLFSYIGGSKYKDMPGVGAYHTEELQYLFNWGVSEETKFSDEQMLIRNRMIKMWSNFVKSGNPTPEVTDLLPVTWVPVTDKISRPYLNIDVNMTMLDHVYHDRIAFWRMFWYTNWKKSVLVHHSHHHRRH